MRYIGLRLFGAIVTLFVSSVAVFSMIRLIPGDPITVLLGQAYDPKVAASLRQRYGLSGSVVRQYLSWLNDTLHGNFGYSIANQQLVSAQLAQRIVRTLELLGGGVIVGMLIAIPAGVIAARRRGRAPDLAVMTFTTAMLSIPQFVLGIVLIIIFGVQLKVLPAGGWVDPHSSLTGWFKSMILPWATIGLTMCAFTARVLRSSMLDAFSQDYVRTARAWGVSERRITRLHVLKNAAVPTLTVVGLEIGYLLGGALVVEQVFAYPGMGQLLIQSIAGRDYPVVQAAVLVFAVGFVIINFLVDILYVVIDPRIRNRRVA